MDVTITVGTGAYVRHGGEPVWQQPVSTVYVGTAPRVVITGTTSELVLSTGTVDVSEDVPAKLISTADHSAIVAWWSAEVERQEAEAETVRLERQSTGNVALRDRDQLHLHRLSSSPAVHAPQRAIGGPGMGTDGSDAGAGLHRRHWTRAGRGLADRYGPSMRRLPSPHRSQPP